MLLYYKKNVGDDKKRMKFDETFYKEESQILFTQYMELSNNRDIFCQICYVRIIK